MSWLPRLTLACAAPLLALPCAQAVMQTVTVLDARGKPASLAAVAVQVKGARALAPAGTVVDMGQRDKRFTPEIVVVQTGTAVNFPNFDTVRHHVYSFSATRKFEIKLYAGTPSTPVVFDRAGTATLGCNIHDTMRGFVHVVDTPYFATTDAQGNATLDLPAGEHVLRVWHAPMGESTPPLEMGLKVGAPVTVKLTP